MAHSLMDYLVRVGKQLPLFMLAKINHVGIAGASSMCRLAT